VSVYVRLRVSSEAFAMPVEHVLEVAELGEVAPVPRTRPEMLGVRNVRGQILPVVDLALLLGIPGTAPPGRLLVAEDGVRRAGFAIEQVSGVGELGDPTEETASDLLAGAIFTDGDLIGVIDVPRIFDLLQGSAALPGAPAPQEESGAQPRAAAPQGSGARPAAAPQESGALQGSGARPGAPP
jgi:purine-binding chemotaxis protein CheW